MEQPIAPHKSPDRGIDPRVVRYLHPELVNKLANSQALTTVISEERLPDYLNAALATGFKVEKIAGEGEKFPVRSEDYVNGEGRIQTKVYNREVVGKGNIAVSIRGPKGIKDCAPFWDNLNSLQQKKA